MLLKNNTRIYTVGMQPKSLDCFDKSLQEKKFFDQKLLYLQTCIAHKVSKKKKRNTSKTPLITICKKIYTKIRFEKNSKTPLITI